VPSCEPLLTFLSILSENPLFSLPTATFAVLAA
jgi:hypothetical protein